MLKVNDRIGAIQSTNRESVNFYGYGIYLGDFVPPKEKGGFFAELGLKNPKLQLDNGSIIWGCECWWAEEEEVKKEIGNRKVIIVEIEALEGEVKE